MKHETFFDIMWLVATSSVPGAILGVVLLAALGLTVFGFVGSFCAFVWNQGKNLKRLYTKREVLDVTELHPFTRSILENRCPEFTKLKELSLSNTKRDKEKILVIVANIVATIELYESHPIGSSIVKELKART